MSTGVTFAVQGVAVRRALRGAADVWRKFFSQYSVAMNEFFPLDTLPEVLTTGEGAQLLRCSKAHFCHLLNGSVPGLPRLPYLRLGRRRLVRKTTLAQWIEQIESGARAQ